MPTLNGVGRTAIDPRDLSAFEAPPKHRVIQGPARLYRFGMGRGKWWFDSALFQTLKEDFYESEYGGGPRQKNEDATLFVRNVLAVSREWNKLTWLSVLTLARGDGLDCFVGLTSPQLEWQKKTDGPLLGGGTPQYLLYETDLIPSRNISDMSLTAIWKQWS